MHRVRILHLSDLHARVAVPSMSPERRNRIQVQKRARELVLGSALDDALDSVRKNGDIDLVCFTGDVADWGLKPEYEQAGIFFRRILRRLGLGLDRLFVVPGNHDVDRNVNADQWKTLRALIAARPDVAQGLGYWAARASKAPHGLNDELLDTVLERQAAFWRWVEHDLGRKDLLPGAVDSNHPTLAYRARLQLSSLPFPIFVLGLNSAWLAGDEDDKGKLLITRQQVDWEGDVPTGMRLALMHHALADLSDWDATEVRRSLSGWAHLLLHGHRHEADLHAHLDRDHALTVIAAGSLYEGDAGDRYVNGWHVIDAELDERGTPRRLEFTFFDWAKRGHWHRSNAISRHTVDGKLRWSPVATLLGIGATEQIPPTLPVDPIRKPLVEIAPSPGSPDPWAEAHRQYSVGNYSAAARHFEIAANCRNGKAAFNLGLMHELGLGCPQNPSEARLWYLRSARRGIPQAMNAIGLLYDHGVGLAPNRVRAAAWYRRAERCGDRDACYNLAALLAAGHGGALD